MIEFSRLSMNSEFIKTKSKVLNRSTATWKTSFETISSRKTKIIWSVYKVELFTKASSKKPNFKFKPWSTSKT